MESVYWKDDSHKRDYDILIEKLYANDIYRKSFAYLVSATGKTDSILNYVNIIGISSKEIKEEIRAYSSSERSMILFALQLFNSNMSDIILHDVVSQLDSYNYKAVLEAIRIRYGEPRQ